jgi:hypothetical protein
MQGECGCLKVASRLKEGTLRVQATNWAFRFEVTTDGAGVVRYAGAVLLQELADRLGLTRILGWRGPQGRRRHPDAQVLWKLAVLRADGGDCLCNLAAFRDHSELFGPVASTPTAWRVIKRAAQDRDGLAWLRAAKAYARERGRGAPTPSCSSSTRTRLWCWRTATTRKVPRAPTRARSGSRRCWPTWTAGLPRASRWPASCGRATPRPAPCSMRAKTPSDAIEPGAESARWRDPTDRALGWTESDAVNEP